MECGDNPLKTGGEIGGKDNLVFDYFGVALLVQLGSCFVLSIRIYLSFLSLAVGRPNKITAPRLNTTTPFSASFRTNNPCEPVESATTKAQSDTTARTIDSFVKNIPIPL
jgi:hypothetical protein